MLSKKIDLSRTESQVGKDVLVCSSQRSGIDVVHVSSMKSSMKFEFYLSKLSTYSYLRWQWMIG